METAEKVAMFAVLAYLAITAMGAMSDKGDSVSEGVKEGVAATTETVGLGVAVGLLGLFLL